MRRALAAVGLALSAVGFAASVGLGVGVWQIKPEVDRTVADRVTKARDANALAGRWNTQVRGEIDVTLDELMIVRDVVMPRRPDAVPGRYAQQIALKLDRIETRIGLAARGVMVAEGQADVWPFGASGLPVRPSGLDQAEYDLKDAAEGLRGSPKTEAPPTAEQWAAAVAALERARQMCAALDRRLDEIDAQVAAAGRQAEAWTGKATVGVTLLAVVGSLGHAVLALVCWRGFGRSARTAAGD